MAAAAPASTLTETPSHGRRIAGATGIMMAAILASRLLGLVRQGVISHQLGKGYWADVFFGAFQIPDLLFYLIAGGALSSAFIPVFTEKLTLERHEDAWRVFSTVSCVMFAVIGVIIIAGEVFTVPLVHLVNAGFPPTEVLDTVPLTRILFPAQMCFFLGGLLMGVQYSMKRFAIPALGPVIYNIGIILGGVLLAPWMGAAGFCWGALGGAFVGNFALQYWAVRKAGMLFRPSFAWRDPDVMKVWKLMLPVVLGVALPQVSIWVNRYYATRMTTGSVSAIFYANQLMQVPLGIFAQAMAVAIFPHLSELAARKEFAALRSNASGGIRSLLFLTIPSSVFMMILALPIVQLLLQAGKFKGMDAEITAVVLAYYCLGIFAWSAQSILARSFYALHDSVTPVVIGTGVTLVFVPLNTLFAWKMNMGVQGLALATSVAAVLHVVLMTEVLRRRLRGFEMGRLLLSVGKTTLASAAGGAVCWMVSSALGGSAAVETHAKLHAAIVLTAGFGAGIVVFLGAAIALRMEELKQALAMLRRRRPSAGPAAPAAE